MPAIFISYRRIDTKAYAGRLFDRLNQHFGPDHVFMDVEGGIERGEDFSQALQRAVAAVDAMIVLIGRQWLTCVDREGRRRLDRPDDWVRQETAVALRRNILILPVLVDGAAMPSEEDLPEDIRPLARRQASEISDTRWTYDVSQIIGILEPKRARIAPKHAAWAAGAALVVAAGVAGLYGLGGDGGQENVLTPPSPTPTPSDRAPANPAPAATPADLTGFWRDDDGVLYKVVTAPGGGFDMARIEPPEEFPTYRSIRVDGRDVEIAIGVLPSGTQQAQGNLQLSPDGRFMTGLLKSTQIEGTPTNWVLKRSAPPASG